MEIFTHLEIIFLSLKINAMKAIVILLCAALVVTSKSYSKNVSPDPPREYQFNSLNEDTIIVPVKIRTAFTTMYPNATRVVWYQYKPATMKVDPAEWYYVLDENDYYASFLMDDADYIAWYDNGVWIHSTKSIDNTELPAPVNQAINTQFPGFAITEVDLEQGKTDLMYEVNLEKGADQWKVHFSPTGSIIKKKQKTATKVEVEDAMAKDFETRYPNATEVTWYKYIPRERVELLPSDWEYGMDENDYQVRYLLDGTEYVAYYDNGVWVRGETTVFDPKKLPATINDAISKQYAGYIIKDVDREESKSQVLYEVELVKGNEKCKIHYTAEGSIAKKKCRTS